MMGGVFALLGALPVGAADEQDKSELSLTAGYDKTATNGFFIRSEDQEFCLNIGACTQPRCDANWRDPQMGRSFYHYGTLAQGGYFFTQKMQVYGQYNLISRAISRVASILLTPLRTASAIFRSPERIAGNPPKSPLVCCWFLIFRQIGGFPG
jgi:hypothetical protein